ncbi:DUF302 domain-containing protein [Paraburkholderia sp. Cpub6]|nr:DUF302 domain-containing protein [Paraburkholderia sp. Cpub6]MBB5456431.1 uncharacterized protein (DUF302 family) [Paraburkholderia sp. Cpub6]
MDPLLRWRIARMRRMLRHGQRVARPADLITRTLPEHNIRTGGMMATASIAENASAGIVTVASTHAGDATAERLQTLILERGLTVFACIDFSGDAGREGLAMPFSRLLIFGNPKAGTPLMQLAPTAALDLPLKVLVWEDADGRAWLSFNSTAYLRERHGLPDDLMKPVSGVAALVDAAAR